MAGYLPHYRKKRNRLRALEEKLQRLIKPGADRETLLKVALEIRDCRIRVVRAKQAENPENTAALRAVFLKDRGRIRVLKAVTSEAVLAEYLPSE